MMPKIQRKLSIEERNLLTNRGWLSTQSPDFQEALLDHCHVRRLPRGQTHFGAMEDKVFVHGLLSGHQDVYIAPFISEPVLAHLVGPGDWGGALMVTANASRRSTVVARTDCEFAYLDENAMGALEQVFADLKVRLASLAARYVDALLTIIACQTEKDVTTRVRLTLLRLLGEPFVPNHDFPGDPVEFPIAQKDIAEMSFLSRNAVGPVLKELENMGAISIGYRKTTVLDRRLIRV